MGVSRFGPPLDFASWYEQRYRPLHAALVAAVGDADVARDAADEAFARALQRWARVGAMESPEGWVWVVARNHARRSARRRARDRAPVRQAEAGPGADIGVDLWDAVERLPRRERELVALRYILGLREVDIAGLLGLAPGTVSRSLHDARQRLRHALTDADTEGNR